MVVRKELRSHCTSSSPSSTSIAAAELQDFIVETREDLRELSEFYNIQLSRTRVTRLTEYVEQCKAELCARFDWKQLDQSARVDWHLIHAHLTQRQQRLRAESSQLCELEPLLAHWALSLVDVCERRQKVIPTDPKSTAAIMSDAGDAIASLATRIKTREFRLPPFAAFRAAQQVDQLRTCLAECYAFYAGYDPLFTWWASKPWELLSAGLTDLVAVMREFLVGIKPGDDDAIVGQPIGRDGIHAELETEVIAYSPDDLLRIGEAQYAWCEHEAIQAAREMGYGDDWRKAQEHVKNMCVDPGQQIHMVHELAREAITYVKQHDMVTVPAVAEECWRTFMMTPEQQKVNPFFLGGESIIVSYPTDTMSHHEKLMVMRGNNRPFSRSTVFHELIPGHHLQFHYMSRSKPYRQMFETPFWIEGWAFYWELILWDRGFPASPENKLGMLFWHMHRCARIVFSLNFHLGRWTPQQCVDYLVHNVGHERANAEGEVRRSFNGDYGALYQAGYMLGALQLYQLRKEILSGRHMTEKQFHDRVMKENTMPIELLRALLIGEELTQDHKASWNFYHL